MRDFCPRCSSDLPTDVASGPRCGLDIPAFRSRRDDPGKPIAALEHPEPETPVRAAWVPRRTCDQRAVAGLIRLLETTQDGCAAREAMEAIAQPAQVAREAARTTRKESP